jgi:Cytochrome c oxidase caa3 assembly factor (Caa3_CtaG)
VIPYLLLAELQNTVLAAILTLSDRVIYPVYLTVPRAGTITALEDQSVAGVIMWVPGSLVFLVAAVGVVMETLGARGQAALQGRLVESEGLVGTQSGPRCTPAFLANAPFRGSCRESAGPINRTMGPRWACCPRCGAR